jgi:hypothetical protein
MKKFMIKKYEKLALTYLFMRDKKLDAVFTGKKNVFKFAINILSMYVLSTLLILQFEEKI